jgi:large subunit ribosomal protein L10
MSKNTIPQWKIEKVEEIAEFLGKYPVIGIISLEGLPSSQFQEIRKKLRGKAEIRISKNVLIEKAIEKLGNENLKKITEYVEGPCGIIASHEDPFRLAIFLKRNRSKTFAKPGSTAAKDIVVSAGETDMPAGPALAELKAVKIEVRLDKGKIVVAKDSLVAKPGDVISAQLASALSRLGVKPVEIGLNVLVFYDNGKVYTASMLDFDEMKFLEEIQAGYINALNLSVDAGYPNSISIMYLLQNAYRNALNLALDANIFTEQTTGQILAKAEANVAALSNILKEKGFNV